MTRRVVWLTVLVLAVLAIGGAWFLANFERVPAKEWTPAQAEARRNGYLALERFLARLGRPLARQSDPRWLDELPAGGVLILDRNRRHHMTPQRLGRLLAWVQAGGYLIVVPELPRVSDPLLARFDVRHPFAGVAATPAGDQGEAADEAQEAAEDPAQGSAEDAAPSTSADRRANAGTARRPPAPAEISVTIPGARAQTIAFHPGLQPGRIRPEWRAGHRAYGDQLLHFVHGRGQITIAAQLDRLLHNQQIGQHDHAELLWTLITTYGGTGPVTLMSRLAVPSLGDWLVESAGTASLSAALLLVLWLWRRLPRFGPVLPEPAPGRRELGEHLAALGRYVWRAGGLDHWLKVARDDFQAKLALHHPAIAALAPGEQAMALARLAARPQSLVAAALAGPATSPHAFTAALRTLKNLERIL